MSYFLESERLYFRDVKESDINENYYAWMNDSEINRNMETWFWPHSLENIYNYWTEHHESRDEPWFAICLKETNEHIGNVKFGKIDWVHRRAYISLFIGKKDLWGQGYGTETIILTSDYAFNRLNLHKVIAGIYVTNLGSIKAFTKAGFQQEAVLFSHAYSNGQYIDVFIYGKINE